MLLRALPHLEAVSDIEAVSIQGLGRLLVGKLHISTVFSPLFWWGGDGIETARLLERHGYRGPYRIVTPPLPRPQIVLRELRVACPTLDVGLISLEADSAG